jgi:hypothetical protein
MNSRERHLAVDVINSRQDNRDQYYGLLFEAFLRADSTNFDLLLPAVEAALKQIDAKCTCNPARTE